MPRSKSIPLRISLRLTDESEVPPLQTYLYSSGGKFLGSAPLENDAAAIDVPRDSDGLRAEVILGPRLEEGQSAPTATSLKRSGAYHERIRIEARRPDIELTLPGIVLPSWCLCVVRGRLFKRVEMPDGTDAERPVCNARVTICEVDQIPRVVAKIPDDTLLRLRDDLLERLQPVPWPPPRRRLPEPPPPRIPGVGSPVPFSDNVESTMATGGASVLDGGASAGLADFGSSVVSIATTSSIIQLRRRLMGLSSSIALHICDLLYLWPYFTKDCLTTVEVDGEGRFSAVIAHDCDDTPDIYLSVEQLQDDGWTTVHEPTIGCGTYWNYPCGTEIALELPSAEGCETPDYDLPDGVSVFVLPWSIRETRIWGIPPVAPAATAPPPAPYGWLRQDGRLDYRWTAPVGAETMHDAPFGGELAFRHDDSYFIPDDNIKYYRYSYRRRRTGNPPNTGAHDETWTPMTRPLSRQYRIDTTDGRARIAYHPVGPVPLGPGNLYEFKPRTPPPEPTDPPDVIAREWQGGNIDESAAVWDTTTVPPDDDTGNRHGTFEVKIEVFNDEGVQVIPEDSTFHFILRNADTTTTRIATPAEMAGGAYVFVVHVDNSPSAADLPQPDIAGVAASDDCGFLRYDAEDEVRLRFCAHHPNDEAVFRFLVKRGSNALASASTTPPYVETAAATAPTTTTPYTLLPAGDPGDPCDDYYQRSFTPGELVGSCVNAAFAANVYVWGKAWDGAERVGYDAGGLIAFALAEDEGDLDD